MYPASLRFLLRPRAALLAAATLAVAGLAVAYVGPRNDLGLTTRSQDGADPAAAPPGGFAAASDVDDSFLPTGTFEYTIRSLGHEETGPGGEIIKAAELEESTYRFVIQDDRTWTETVLTGPRAGTVRRLADGVLTQFDPDGTLVASHDYGEDLVAGRQELLLGMASQIHTGWTRDGYRLGVERRTPDRTIRRYVGAPQSDDRQYRSLPWKAAGNERSYEIEFLPGGRVASITDQLNGTVVYQFVLTRG